MKSTLSDEKHLTIVSIEALGLSDLERNRALMALAKADALMGAFFAIRKLLQRSSRRAVARPHLKSQ
jgi:hypothetical protein